MNLDHVCPIHPMECRCPSLTCAAHTQHSQERIKEVVDKAVEVAETQGFQVGHLEHSQESELIDERLMHSIGCCEGLLKGCPCVCHSEEEEWNTKLDNFVRDVCSVVPKSKSDVWRRIQGLLQQREEKSYHKGYYEGLKQNDIKPPQNQLKEAFAAGRLAERKRLLKIIRNLQGHETVEQLEALFAPKTE